MDLTDSVGCYHYELQTTACHKASDIRAMVAAC